MQYPPASAGAILDSLTSCIQCADPTIEADVQILTDIATNLAQSSNSNILFEANLVGVANIASDTYSSVAAQSALVSEISESFTSAYPSVNHLPNLDCALTQRFNWPALERTCTNL